MAQCTTVASQMHGLHVVLRYVGLDHCSRANGPPDSMLEKQAAVVLMRTVFLNLSSDGVAVASGSREPFHIVLVCITKRCGVWGTLRRQAVPGSPYGTHGGTKTEWGHRPTNQQRPRASAHTQAQGQAPHRVYILHPAHSLSATCHISSQCNQPSPRTHRHLSRHHGSNTGMSSR